MEIFTKLKQMYRLNRDEIKVTAVDTAGNQKTMSVEVIPSELSDLKSMTIKIEKILMFKK